MAMTYASLTGAKGSAGAIMTWVNYSKIAIDLDTFIQETQSLLATLLRTREMTSLYQFTVPLFGSRLSLPTGFLDPIGTMFCPSINQRYSHRDPTWVQNQRNYNETTGALQINPFTTVTGSPLVTVALTNHGFTQESLFFTTGATAFNGVTIAGTFPIDSITDVNNFVIDTTILGALPSADGTGGGAAALYTCNILEQGSAMYWSIWDEQIHFDTAFDKQQTLQLGYYKRFPFISNTVSENFITQRYPFLMRKAIDCMAFNWMQESSREATELQVLSAMTDKISAENDMHMRGGEYYTENPGDDY